MSEQPSVPTGIATETRATPEGGPAAFRYAGIGNRFVAVLIDGVLLGILLAILDGGRETSPTLVFVLYVAYVTIMLGRFGQTLGKMAMHVRVVKYDGQLPGYGTAFVRTLATYLSSAVLLIGYLWAFFNEKHQTWHDLIAQTYVIDDSH